MKYTTQHQRYGNIEVGDNTLRTDKESIQTLINHIKEHDKKMMNIWEWEKRGRTFLEDYMNYKETIGGVKCKWTKGTINSQYRRIRAFFNYIAHHYDGFQDKLLNNMKFKKAKIRTETFSDSIVSIPLISIQALNGLIDGPVFLINGLIVCEGVVFIFYITFR